MFQVVFLHHLRTLRITSCILATVPQLDDWRCSSDGSKNLFYWVPLGRFSLILTFFLNHTRFPLIFLIFF
ncbi:hypothetical protein Hanom_Chr06g00579021 [Helianthus anomalus]